MVGFFFKYKTCTCMYGCVLRNLHICDHVQPTGLHVNQERFCQDLEYF